MSCSPDIVERLRRKQAFVRTGYAYDATLGIDPDCIEAADEIERLRAAQCSAATATPRDLQCVDAVTGQWRLRTAEEIAALTPDDAQPSPEMALRNGASHD